MRPKITVHGKLRFSDDGRLMSPVPLANIRVSAGVAKSVPINDPEAEKVFFELQRKEPQQITWNVWIYKDNVIRVEGGVSGDVEADILEIKHHVLRQERNYQKMKREVQAFENMEKMDDIHAYRFLRPLECSSGNVTAVSA